LNLPFYIAKRYLVSRKSHHIINIISGISVAGVTIGTMALIIILSVFNGFESLVISLFNSFDPDLKIEAVRGKVFTPKDIPAEEIKKIPGVIRFTEVVEENALLKYKNKQYIATIKGVSPDFEDMHVLDSMLIDGEMKLKRGSHAQGILGLGVAYYLGIQVNDPLNSIHVYVPKRTKKTLASLEDAFNSDNLAPAGVFSIQQDFDAKYVIAPIDFARGLLEYSDEVTSIEIGLTPQTNVDLVQERIASVIGDAFSVRNRFQQQETLYKVMKSEKLAIFLILTFILFIATFNIIGSLSMLIIDKKKDIAVLQSLGAGPGLIKRIFMAEGLLISLTGAMLGLFLGGLICWLQQTFGMVPLEGGSESFVIDAYPVEMRIMDFLFVFLTVFGIGVLAAWYPVRQVSRKYLHLKLA
jgi:lipoprotein-releasing system permease protein